MIALVTVLGDYFLKRAGQDEQINWAYFAAGGLVYALTAFGWLYGMRHLKLATLGVVFSVSMVLFMAILGAAVFRESLNRNEWIGVGLAVVSLVLLTRFSS